MCTYKCMLKKGFILTGMDDISSCRVSVFFCQVISFVMKCSSSIVPVVPNKTTVVMPHCLSIGLILILGCEALSLNFVLKWIHFHFNYCRLCHALFFFLHTCRFMSPQIKTSQLAALWWLVMWVKPLSLPLSTKARSQKENTHLIMTQPFIILTVIKTEKHNQHLIKIWRAGGPDALHRVFTIC